MMCKVKWILPQTQITQENITQFECQFKVILPNDFKKWLLSHNGSCPEPSVLNTKEVDNVNVNCFLSFSKKDEYNVYDIINIMQDRIPKDIIPIADDGGGNYICYRFSSSPPNIVFWDHEEADPEIAVKNICSSFDDLITLLEK